MTDHYNPGSLALIRELMVRRNITDASMVARTREILDIPNEDEVSSDEKIRQLGRHWNNSAL